MSTHNLCFGAKIRKIVFCYTKVGFKGVYITRKCFRDGQKNKTEVCENIIFSKI